MSNTDFASDLADLGLDLNTDADNTAAPGADVDANTGVKEDTTDKEKQTRKAVTFGEVSVADEPEELEDIRRGGGGTRESKYDFSDIKAPVNKGSDDAPKWAYFSKTYHPGEGTEVVELDRSVKSAATGANRANRKSGTVERYATRAVNNEQGVQVGTKVIRVDATTGIDRTEK